jgi:hypothetical protein
MGLGKPCAGKPPARFDEGEVIRVLCALITSLLYPILRFRTSPKKLIHLRHEARRRSDGPAVAVDECV